ncbi:MAG: NAD-dependent protein deacylase [Proteobacteria bacterium]|nr:NAD-dependent protein deacylase [Pseudomonadota bacterium]
MTQAIFGERIDEVVSLLKRSNRILFITGAGISADSGLPTYRGISGLYNDKQTDEGIRIESALSGTMFKRCPKITWKYISQIEEHCRGKSYNRGHEVLAEMESHFERICILTQNVDGFHQKAGSKNVIDIHGNIHDLYCVECSYRTLVPDYSTLQIPPECPKCGKVVRPDIVLFEELLSTRKTQSLSEELQNGFDLVFSIGTTSVFPYIAQPVVLARHCGIPTVEINPAVTRISRLCGIRIAEKAAKSLNAIWMRYRQ